jgi:hypothetical protein
MLEQTGQFTRIMLTGFPISDLRFSFCTESSFGIVVALVDVPGTMIVFLQFTHVTFFPMARFGTQLVVKHEVHLKVIVESPPGRSLPPTFYL